MLHFSGDISVEDLLIVDPCYLADRAMQYEKVFRRSMKADLFIAKEKDADDGDSFLKMVLLLQQVNNDIPCGLVRLNNDGIVVPHNALEPRAPSSFIPVETASIYIGGSKYFDRDNTIRLGGDGVMGPVTEWALPAKKAAQISPLSPTKVRSGYQATVVEMAFDDTLVSESFLYQYLVSNLGLQNIYVH